MKRFISHFITGFTILKANLVAGMLAVNHPDNVVQTDLDHVADRGLGKEGNVRSD